MKNLKISNSKIGLLSKAINTSDSYYAGELETDTNQSITVPTAANTCVFSANGDFYVRYDGSAATVPTGSIGADFVDLNPSVRDVSQVTTLNIVAEDTTKITLAFYA